MRRASESDRSSAQPVTMTRPPAAGRRGPGATAASAAAASGGTMHLSGVTEIAAARQRVWATISDPNRAAAGSSEGQAQIEKIDDTHYRVSVSAKTAMGPVNVVLDLELTEVENDIHRPHRRLGRDADAVVRVVDLLDLGLAFRAAGGRSVRVADGSPDALATGRDLGHAG